MMKENPLVSIIVISYNSSKYILETLESAKAQTYQNIELIISDDGSKDETIVICRSWLDENKKRFTSTQIVTVEQNTGIPANCNRGVKAAHGEWIKLIAGDDVLLQNCVGSNISHISINQNINVLQTVSKYYNEKFDKCNYIGGGPLNISFFSKSAEEQNSLLKKRNVVIAPSIFLSKNAILKVGGFDEDFRLFEDITMWLNLTNAGIKIYFLDIETVNYRLHPKSVAKQGKTNISSPYCREELMFWEKYLTIKDKFTPSYSKRMLKLKLLILFEKLGLNNSSTFSKYLYMITWKILS